jgi:excisionase family DNA binding protein
VSLEEMLAQRGTALTVKDVAQVLNVSQRLIYQQVQIGEIPHFRVGAAVRFEPATLAKWLHGKMEAWHRRQNRFFKPYFRGGPGKREVPKTLWRMVLET